MPEIKTKTLQNSQGIRENPNFQSVREGGSPKRTEKTGFLLPQ
jgi:hypothetical protein